MSVLRMLSPTRGASSSSPSRKAADSVQINLRVPSYGSVFMPFPDPLAYHSDAPRSDKELFGDLEISIPAGMGRQKCKAIRVGVRTVTKLDMGRGKPEEDVVYEGKVEVRGGTADGVVLEEGLQRFTFNIIIPGNLAPHDYHPGHRVDNILFAEVEGVEEEAGITSWFRRSSSTSASTSRGTTPSSSPRLSPLRPGSGPSSPLMSPAQSLSILRQEIALPQPPAYDLSAPEEVVPWLSGVHYVERPLILIYNPDPAGGVSSLDVRMDTDAPGIGPVAISYIADEWSIFARLKGKVTLPAPAPDVTVFYVRASLIQNVEITSPRDGKVVKAERQFPVFSSGTELPMMQRPGKDCRAIWRGRGAGGTNESELALDGQGRLPNDYEGRPTTLEGVETPIKVSHILRLEVFFSVHGENVQGEKFPDGGPGELRVMKVDKKVVVPACFLIPEVLDLPIYEADDNCPMWASAGKTCPLCKTPSTQQFCRSCPPTAIPHPRHDHSPKVVGNASGVCGLCSQRVLPAGQGEWRDCACGLLREDIIDRMKRISLGDRENQEDEEEMRGRRGREEKEEAERGRR